MADGASAIDDVDFLQSFHPSAANVARDWPSSNEMSFPMDNDKLNYLVMTFFDKEMNVYAGLWNNMSFEEREQRRMQIIQKVTFNLPIGAISFDEHPLVHAFRHGFNLLIRPPARIQLFDIFGSRSKDLFPILTQRLPQDGASIVDLIKFQVNDRFRVDEDSVWEDAPPSLHVNAEKFERLLKWYLLGIGLVQHSDFHGLISQMEYEQYARDPSLRARKFLLYTTGREVSPTLTTVQPKLVFNHIIREENLMPKPFDVHSCFGEVNIWICPELERLLNDPIPVDVNVPTAFDVYLHGIWATAGFDHYQQN